MNNRNKQIRKLLAEKGFDSFDDLSERLNNFPETRSAKDIEDELAKLKLQLINPQPLFTLTAEEVEIVERNLINVFTFDEEELNKIRTRIEQWKDENEI